MVLSYDILAVLLLAVALWAESGEALSSFGFDMHHRYSDSVKKILGIDGLPEMDTLEYYKAMVHRDNLLKGRRLAGGVDSTPPLTFVQGNDTYRIPDLGFLHYAFVDVGTPKLTFLVALDTGSDLFWLPCECTQCARNFTLGSGDTIDFNIYSRNASTTSSTISCNSSMCGGATSECLAGRTCAYQARYLSANTSSTGILVQDLLYLATNDDQKHVATQITLGCGMIQTGAFLTTGAPNGLFGLGMENVSVPSILSNKGLTANSFSMCFGTTGNLGRIEFGDKGSYAQGQTPFNLEQSHPSYNISIIQVAAGEKSANITLTALFDTGTSFTILEDPSYTIITETFNSQVEDTRHLESEDYGIPFEYCYNLNSTSRGLVPPKYSSLSLTMKGGDQFNVSRPIVIFIIKDVGNVYCLAIIKSSDISIIGQNFMTGNRIVFDRENMVLGWKESSCYDIEKSKTGSGTSLPFPPTPTPTPPTLLENKTEALPTTDLPEATPRGGNAPPSNSFTGKFVIVLFSLFSHYLINLSS